MKSNPTLLTLLLAAGLLLWGCAAPPTAPPAAPAAPTTATAGATTVVAVAPPAQPCCPHQTLWEFLGVKGLIKDLEGLGSCILNDLGSIFPGLELKPPLLAIANPQNLQSSNPAVAAAAGAKADEDQAAQKIKAIRYLATLGCAGCYPGVEDALLAALDDCTEAVRFEAVKALRDLSGKPCCNCKTKSCCSPKVRKKLEEVANKMVNGCYQESSDRVRRLARLALAGCGGGPPPTANNAAPQEGPSEGPEPGAGPKKPPTAGQPHLANPTVASADTGAGADSAPDVTPASSTTSASGGAGQSGKPHAATAQSAIEIQMPAADSDCGCTRPSSILIPVSPAPAAAPATNSSAAANPQPPTPNPSPSSSPVVHSASVATGAVLAEVNGEPVYEGEVLPEADRRLSEAGPGISLEDKLHMRPDYIRRELFRVIDRKLICQEAKRSATVTPASFNAAEDDEAALAEHWMEAIAPVDQFISPEEILAYYRANQAKYPRPAEVRYEQVSARFDHFTSREEALAAIEYARNLATGVAATAPKANLAALEPRTFSWTMRDEAGLPEVAAELFRLPVGAVSPVLDTGDSWRIVRVLERHAAGTAPLELVGELVRQQILRDRRAYLDEAHLRQLRPQARVWTVFDPQAQARVTGARAFQETPTR